jgi:phage-related protein
MKLVRIAKGRWEVLAVVDHRGRCQVLDFVAQLGAGFRAAQEFLTLLLRVYLPLEGPPKSSAHLCKPLGDGVFELRRQPRGPKPRVLFFYDEDHRIVCTNAFSKLEVTPRSEIELARGLREKYFETKLRRELQVVEEG